MSYRQLSIELQTKAQEELNENPENIQDDLEHIKEWIKKQPHLKARTDDQWLLAFLRHAKFNLEQTKEKIDMFYTLRTMVPEFFKNRDFRNPEIFYLLKLGVYIIIPEANNATAPCTLLIRPNIYNPKEVDINDVLKIAMMLIDIIMLEEDSFTINGVNIIYDVKGLTGHHIPMPTVTKKAFLSFFQAYPNRVKALHYLYVSSVFDKLFGLIKPFFTEKIKNRIYMHENLESLYNYVPKDNLPKEYGGNNKSLQEIIDIYLEKVEKYRDWFLEDEEYGTNEKLRLGKPKTIEEIFGVEGSFRQLELD